MEMVQLTLGLTGPEDDNYKLSRAAQHAWGDWLGQFQWHHFATLTFTAQPSSGGAKSLFRGWLRRLEQQAKLSLGWFYVLERGAAGLLHVHVLTAGTTNLGICAMESAWANGRSDVSVYEPTRGAAHYVTKGLGGRAEDYDFCLPSSFSLIPS
jgi:hypothetical protein